MDKKKNLETFEEAENTTGEPTTDKPMKDEIADLIKPIAIHEAKSAFYKAKLAGYVLKKGAEGAQVAAKFIHGKTGELIEKRKSKKKKK